VRVAGLAASSSPLRASNVDFGGALFLGGYDLAPLQLSPGGRARITLHWTPVGSLNRDYTTFVHLINADGVVVAASDHRPGAAYYPTTLWRPGVTVLDAHDLDLAPDLGRAPYAILVGVYSATSGAGLAHLGQPTTVGLAGASRPADALPPGQYHRSDAVLGGQLALRGYEVTAGGGTVTVRMYWQAVRVPDSDFTVFVHLLDARGGIVAQLDRRPLGGTLPTTSWPAGYLVADDWRVDVPSGVGTGRYAVLAGAYGAAGDLPLPVVDGRGEAAGKSVSLGDVIWPGR
jgi:hypothetical protein